MILHIDSKNQHMNRRQCGYISGKKNSEMGIKSRKYEKNAEMGIKILTSLFMCGIIVAERR